MKIKYIFWIMFIFASLVSCKSNIDENLDPVKYFLDMQNAKSEQDLEKFYSSSTLSAVKKLKSKYPQTEVLIGLDRKLFSGNLEYQISKKKVSGKKCKLELVVKNHDSINFIGITVKLNLVYEDSYWKIDRSRELSKQL